MTIYFGQLTNNNGNVQTITVPGLAQPFVKTYGYDELNRLANATETNNGSQQWNQTFGFDRYGNRNITAGFRQTSLTFDASNNKITTSGYSYDAVGSTTADPSGKTFAYDGENKQGSVVNGGTTVGVYTYDADGKRVAKNNSEDMYFVYDAGGRLIEERNSWNGKLQKTYIYAGSRLLSIESSTGTSYLTQDHLGSPRINTSGSGTVTARHDYLPFGEEITSSITPLRSGYSSDTVRKKFTGYERDDESGLDFAEARMYGGTLGRFTSPDPKMSSAQKIDPQSFNRYSYVSNNPLNYTDPTGLDKKGKGTCVSNVVAGVEGGQKQTTCFDENGKEIVPKKKKKKENSRSTTGGGSWFSTRRKSTTERTVPGAHEPSNETSSLNAADSDPTIDCNPSILQRFVGMNGTSQIGFHGTGLYGPFAATGGVGIAVDERGNFALYTESGVGTGGGADISFGVNLMKSNAPDIRDLSGIFINGSGTAGAGGSVAVNVSAGAARDGRTPIVNAGVNIGIGAGGGVSGTITNTNIVGRLNIWEMLDPKGRPCKQQ